MAQRYAGKTPHLPSSTDRSASASTPRLSIARSFFMQASLSAFRWPSKGGGSALLRYDGTHALYSNDTKRVKSMESLNEALRVLMDLHDSIPDDYFGAWQNTVKKLDTLVLDKNVYQLVEEYLNTLPNKTRKSLIDSFNDTKFRAY